MTFSISWAMMLRSAKSGLLKTLAKDAFGQDMLDDHLLHRGVREVGLRAWRAELGEIFEGLNKTGVGVVFALDQFLQSSANSGSLLLNSLTALPTPRLGGLVFEEDFRVSTRCSGWDRSALKYSGRPAR